MKGKKISITRNYITILFQLKAEGRLDKVDIKCLDLNIYCLKSNSFVLKRMAIPGMEGLIQYVHYKAFYKTAANNLARNIEKALMPFKDLLNKQ